MTRKWHQCIAKHVYCADFVIKFAQKRGVRSYCSSKGQVRAAAVVSEAKVTAQSGQVLPRSALDRFNAYSLDPP